ncbi:Hypothetical predicted protein [Octopus vulgaris]|uniref:Uncharacterized protein n=1 Tax=Octopus vulgaris TaxID=6645 RepID=A0AA36FEU0_OCTVU|nr:Hypothetical predicted protein [Octopus vulgaris]
MSITLACLSRRSDVERYPFPYGDTKELRLQYKICMITSTCYYYFCNIYWKYYCLSSDINSGNMNKLRDVLCQTSFD